jgi:hypothetical protein
LRVVELELMVPGNLDSLRVKAIIGGPNLHD